MSADTSDSLFSIVYTSEIQTPDGSKPIHMVDLSDLIVVYCILDKDNMWKKMAKLMGYNLIDIYRIELMAPLNKCTNAMQLLSLWGDQNHTVLELYMLLNKLKQFLGMNCLKNLVPVPYHRLIKNDEELSHESFVISSQNSSFYKSQKILNGPEMSRDTNGSEFSLSMDMMKSSNETAFNVTNLKKMAETIPRVKYHDLVVATNNWHPSNILGRGGFGEVFKGVWKNTDVAIKKIIYHGAIQDVKQKARIQLKQSLNELKHLNSCRHDNILPIFGYSLDQNVLNAEPCLIYKYMPGGSLESRIHPKRYAKSVPFVPLTFKERNKIALETALGLQYLHTFMSGKPLIHGDIKPANILLDVYLSPRIGDFGLVREGSIEPTEVSRPYGTRPYLPNDFMFNRTLSTKTDTYSFGVVLFELYTAMKVYDPNRCKNLAYLAQYMHSNYNNGTLPINEPLDKSLKFDYPDQSMVVYTNLIGIALKCTEEMADDRPEMVEVYNNLDKVIGDYKN